MESTPSGLAPTPGPLEHNPEALAQLEIKGEENGQKVETEEQKPAQLQTPIPPIDQQQQQPNSEQPAVNQTPEVQQQQQQQVQGQVLGQEQGQGYEVGGETAEHDQNKRKRKMTPNATPELKQEGEEGGQKKRRGRPKGSKNKPRSESKGEEHLTHIVPDGSVTIINEAKTPYNTNNQSPLGVHLKPLVLTIQQGEDITQKLKSFCEEHQCSVVVQAATGTLSEATLTQQCTRNGVVLKDTFTILSLSGALLRSAEDFTVTWFLTASLAAPDGGVVGGQVSGALAAASSVIIVIGYWRDQPITGGNVETGVRHDQPLMNENGGENDQNFMNDVGDHGDQ